MIGLINADRLQIEVVTKALFEPLESVTAYEKSIPILYRQPFETKIYEPILETVLDPTDCNKNFDYDFCLFIEACHATTNKIHDLLNDDMKYQYLDFINTALPNERIKRGIQFIGDFFTWCCNVVTTEQTTVLYNNQEHSKFVSIEYRYHIK